MSRRINLATMPYEKLQSLAAAEGKPAMKEDTEDERMNLAELLITSTRNKYFYDEDELKKKINTSVTAGSNDDEEDGDGDYDYNDGFLVKDEDYNSEEDDVDYVPSKESEDEADQTSDSDHETPTNHENPAKRKRAPAGGDEPEEKQQGSRKHKTV